MILKCEKKTRGKICTEKYTEFARGFALGFTRDFHILGYLIIDFLLDFGNLIA